jgi:hypothetical protein
VQTAEHFPIGFSVSEDFVERGSQESFSHFLVRITRILQNLPNQSFIVSHFDWIQNFVKLALSGVQLDAIPRSSLTFIDGNKAVWLAKQTYKEVS